LIDSIAEAKYLTEAEQLGKMRFYGIPTIGKTWEVCKVSLKKGT
jgi:hypothetical protein